MKEPLQRIWDWFFAPLVHYKPNQESVNDWMEALWDIKNREIIKYEARRYFKIPGLYCAAPLLRVQGVGNRRVIRGQHLWVRHEGPDEVHLERGKLGKESVFVLTGSQWNSIAANLEEIG